MIATLKQAHNLRLTNFVDNALGFVETVLHRLNAIAHVRRGWSKSQSAVLRARRRDEPRYGRECNRDAKLCGRARSRGAASAEPGDGAEVRRDGEARRGMPARRGATMERCGEAW